MRGLVAAFVVIFSLVACHGGEAITEVDDGPFGGVYGLRTINDFALPIYSWPSWYPGRSTTPGVLTTSMRSADLSIRPDGSFLWATQLEEMVAQPQSMLVAYVFWNVRREAYGTWTYSESTGAVSLEGTDQSGAYVLTGSTDGAILTLRSNAPGQPSWTFVLQR